MARGGVPYHLRKVLARGVSSGVTIWGRYMGSDGSNGTKTLENKCGITAAGDRAEDVTARG